MFYSFDHIITTADTEANPHEEEMQLTAGVIHQVDVLFEDGCNHEAKVQIYQAGKQLWPSNRGEALRGNATVISFREFFELVSGATTLRARIWGDGTIDDVEVLINIGLLPRKIIQPFTLDELIKAALEG
jgi:hypothetical protein